MDERNVLRLAALAEVAIASSDVSTLLSQITELVQRLVPSTDASLILWDAVDETFSVSVSTVQEQRPEYVLSKVRSSGGASRWIVDNQSHFAVNNLSDDPFTASEMLSESDLEAYLGVPVLFEGAVLGVLYALNQSTRVWSQADVDFMTILAGRAASAIAFARLFEQVQLLANTDELTGVPNRRAFMVHATNEFERSIRSGHSLSAIMVDVDHFKDINDRYGHEIGDDVLVEVADRCQSELRSVDVFGRIGGEEFGVLLPDTEIDLAVRVAERLRTTVTSTPIDTKLGPVDITITLGLAERSDSSKGVAMLLNEADAALYEGKSLGRNRVVRPPLGPNE